MESEPTPLQIGLNDLVICFKAAMQSQDNAEGNRIFQLVLAHCEKTIVKVQSDYGNLKNYIEEEASSVLGKCLMKFGGGTSFRGYFRAALHNAARSEWTRRKKLQDFVIDEHDEATNAECRQTDEVAEKTMALNEDIDLYISRKRSLVDQLQLRPAMKMATLLLDQRLRCAKLVRTSVPTRFSDWIERHESWKPDDYKRFVDSANGPSINSVWNAFATDLESRTDPVTQELMVKSIVARGGKVSLETWRQRVCRYLKSVKDQVDEEEYRYFYPHV